MIYNIIFLGKQGLKRKSKNINYFILSKKMLFFEKEKKDDLFIII